METFLTILACVILFFIGILSMVVNIFELPECMTMIEKSIEITDIDTELIKSKIDACKLLFGEAE